MRTVFWILTHLRASSDGFHIPVGLSSDYSDMKLLQTLQRRLIKPSDLAEKRWLRWLGQHLYAPHLWHFGRRPVARAAGLGMMVAFCPLPIHMLIAIPLALVSGGNLPILIAVSWLSNPVTYVPVFYTAYRVGILFTGDATRSVETLHLSPNWASLQHVFAQIWVPLCIGAIICGAVGGILTYIAVESLWRYNTARRWRSRLKRRQSSR